MAQRWILQTIAFWPGFPGSSAPRPHHRTGPSWLADPWMVIYGYSGLWAPFALPRLHHHYHILPPHTPLLLLFEHLYFLPIRIIPRLAFQNPQHEGALDSDLHLPSWIWPPVARGCDAWSLQRTQSTLHWVSLTASYLQSFECYLNWKFSQSRSADPPKPGPLSVSESWSDSAF